MREMWETVKIILEIIKIEIPEVDPGAQPLGVGTGVGTEEGIGLGVGAGKLLW